MSLAFLSPRVLFAGGASPRAAAEPFAVSSAPFGQPPTSAAAALVAANLAGVDAEFDRGCGDAEAAA